MSMLLYNLLKNEIRSGNGLTNKPELSKVNTSVVKGLYYNYGKKEILGFQNNKLMRSLDGGRSWSVAYTSAVIDSRTPSHVFVAKNGNIFIWAWGGYLLVLDSNFQLLATITDNFAPLNTTVGVAENDGLIMKSEYSGPNGIDGKRILKSTDNGLTWTTAYEDLTIDHWHSVQYDLYGSAWWGCAGDASGKEKIVRSLDNGLTWVEMIVGGQDHRACGLGFTEKYIVWIPDNPSAGDNNKIYRIDRALVGTWSTSEEVVKSGITGASYGCTRTLDGRVLFYTSAELTPYSAIYLSDGENVEMLFRTFKDHNSIVLLAGFSQVTHADDNNISYVGISETLKMNGVYRLKIPFYGE